MSLLLKRTNLMVVVATLATTLSPADATGQNPMDGLPPKIRAVVQDMELIFVKGPIGFIVGERGSSAVRIWALGTVSAVVSTEDEKIHTVPHQEITRLGVRDGGWTFLGGTSSLKEIADLCRIKDTSGSRYGTVAQTDELEGVLHPMNRVVMTEPTPVEPVAPVTPPEPKPEAFVIVGGPPAVEPPDEPKRVIAPTKTTPAPPAAEPVVEPPGLLEQAWLKYAVIGVIALAIGLFLRR